MANSKTDMTDVVKALLAQAERTNEMLAKMDRRLTAVSSTVDQVVGVDRTPSAPTDAPAAKRAARLTLPEQVLHLIKQKPRDTTEIMKELGIVKTSAWAAIAQLERTQEAIVVSLPGDRGRRGPSRVYHPSSPELAAMLKRSS